MHPGVRCVRPQDIHGTEHQAFVRLEKGAGGQGLQGAAELNGKTPCVRCVVCPRIRKQRGRIRRTLRRVISSDGEQADLRIFQATWARKRTEPVLFQWLRSAMSSSDNDRVAMPRPKGPLLLLAPSFLPPMLLPAGGRGGGRSEGWLSRAGAQTPRYRLHPPWLPTGKQLRASTPTGEPSRLPSGLRRRRQAL